MRHTFSATCSKCGETQEIGLEAKDPSHVIESAIRQSERAKVEGEIVAWLRAKWLWLPSGDFVSNTDKACPPLKFDREQVAERIERGEHRKP